MDDKLKARLAGAGVLLVAAFVLVSLLPTPGKVDAPPPDEVVTIPLYEERTETPLPPSSATVPASLASPTVADGDGTATQDVEGAGDDDAPVDAVIDEVPAELAQAPVVAKPQPKPEPKPVAEPKPKAAPKPDLKPTPPVTVAPALPPAAVVPPPKAVTPAPAVVAPVPKPAPKIETPPATSPAGAVKPTEPAVAAAPKPAAPVAKPATLAARAETWFVQVGGFADIANARQAQDRLKAAGQASILSPIGTAQGTLYRVRIGPFASREAAAPALARATGAGFAAAKIASP